MSCSVFFALRNCIEEARKDAGNTTYFDFCEYSLFELLKQNGQFCVKNDRSLYILRTYSWFAESHQVFNVFEYASSIDTVLVATVVKPTSTTT